MALLVSTLLAGCEQTRNAIGLQKRAPDEFAVVTRAPLSMPPDFGLRTPEPGKERPQEKAVRNKAREILIGNGNRRGGAAASGSFSQGEAAILSRAGALNADPSIRRKVDEESSAIAASSTGFMDKVLFWQKPAEPGSIVDAGKETRRLREASAMGKPANEGDVPVIVRKERGILEGIF